MNAQEAKRLLEERNAPLTSEVVELLGLKDEDQIEEAPEDANREPNEDEVRCLRTGRIGKKMVFDPFDDQIGAFLIANISQESWEAWMEMSIKVINELRLDLGEGEHQQVYENYMRDFLKLPAELFEKSSQ